MTTTPEATCGRHPLEGTTPVARQSRIQGVRLHRPVHGGQRSH